MPRSFYALVLAAIRNFPPYRDLRAPSRSPNFGEYGSKTREYTTPCVSALTLLPRRARRYRRNYRSSHLDRRPCWPLLGVIHLIGAAGAFNIRIFDLVFSKPRAKHTAPRFLSFSLFSRALDPVGSEFQRPLAFRLHVRLWVVGNLAFPRLRQAGFGAVTKTPALKVIKTHRPS